MKDYYALIERQIKRTILKQNTKAVLVFRMCNGNSNKSAEQ